MTDRDNAASPPEPDDVPREPSKQELDAARAGSIDSPVDPVSDVQDDGLAWPESAEDAPPASGTEHPPSRPAVIAGAVLAAVLLALAIIAAFQDPKSYMAEINKQQIAGVAQVLKDEKIADYTADQVKAAQQSFADEGATRDMTNDSAAAALNAGKPDSVTADQIKDVLAKKKAQFQTVEGLQSGLRSQIILFALTGALMAVGTLFYQRGKAWARYIGMFVSGFIAVMYVMQVVQGALNIPGIVITLSAIAAFYFFMKGRLDDPPARRAGGGGFGGGGFGGLGSLFAPRGPRNRPAE